MYDIDCQTCQVVEHKSAMQQIPISMRTIMLGFGVIPREIARRDRLSHDPELNGFEKPPEDVDYMEPTDGFWRFHRDDRIGGDGQCIYSVL